MTVPDELICEMAQIHKRPAVDDLPFGFHLVAWRLDSEGYVFSGGESFGNFLFLILWRSTCIIAAFLSISFNFSMCLALRYSSRSITVIGPVW